jgi:hypothetical protein
MTIPNGLHSVRKLEANWIEPLPRWIDQPCLCNRHLDIEESGQLRRQSMGVGNPSGQPMDLGSNFRRFESSRPQPLLTAPSGCRQRGDTSCRDFS